MSGLVDGAVADVSDPARSAAGPVVRPGSLSGRLGDLSPANASIEAAAQAAEEAGAARRAAWPKSSLPGASAVQIGTAAFARPFVMTEIVRELPALADQTHRPYWNLLLL